MARKPKVRGVFGDNSGALPDQSEYRQALAMFVLIQDEKKAMAERHKRLRKRVCEAKGIAQEDVAFMLKMKDDSLADIVRVIQRKAHSLGAMFGKTFQLDMFAPDPEAGEAIRLKGTLSGVSGESAVPPPTLNNEERNIWLEGHQQGADAREATVKEMSAEFTEGHDGDFSEPALKDRALAAANKKKAKQVGLQAAQDFADDQGGPTADETNVVPPSQSQRAEQARQEAGIDA